MFIYLVINRIETYQKAIRYCFPFISMSFFVGLINVFWDADSLPTPDSEMILDPGVINRFFLIGKNFFFYLYKTFVPLELMFSYPRHEIERGRIFDILPSLVLSLYLLSLIYRFIKKLKIHQFEYGIVTAFCLLLPILGLVEVYYMRFSYTAEHYLNLAMVGLLFTFLAFVNNKKIILAIYLFPILLCFKTFAYLPEYQSEEQLMLATLKKNPESILANNLLGQFYKNQNDLNKARFYIEFSIKIKPTAQAYYNLASLHERLGLMDLALRNYLKSSELNPFVPQTDEKLGVLAAGRGDLSLAIKYFKSAIQKSSSYSSAYYNLGYIYESQKNITEANKWYRQAFKLAPTIELYKSAVVRTSTGPNSF
jgi:tetratricopeptide (TPR) repeat protein